MTDKEPHPIDIRAGRNLRFYRMRAGVSQEALAEQLGLTFQQVQKYERGSNRISASRLWECGQILKVPVGAFFAEPDEAADAMFDTGDKDPLFAKWVRLYNSLDPDTQPHAIKLVKLLNNALANEPDEE